MTDDFDAIIIGAGQAGPPLAGRLTSAGMRVALIERHLIGGTCVNTGCTPTKALVASARVAHMARRAAEFGVEIGGDISVSMRAVSARANEIAAGSRQRNEDWLSGMARLTLIRGHARFTSAQTVSVNGMSLSARRIFINTGGRATIPNMPGVSDVSLLTNSGMMQVDVLPRHLVIVGGSYIGLEFAQMYRRFGADVTLVEKGPRLVSREDEDISAALHDILEAEGIAIRTHAECISFQPAGDDIHVALSCTSGAPELTASHVLLAVGRTPNTHDLGLDKAGITVDKRSFITVGEDLQTSVDGVYALGDCNGRGAFTHTAYNDFEIVAANLLDGECRKVSDRVPGYALYTDPPLGRAGMTEREARAAGKRLLIGTRPMARIGRAIEKSETQGFMKIIADADTQRILGAAILGVEGDEAIHGILNAMNADVPYTTLQHSVPVHPTVSELIPTVLESLAPA
ncbi:FAD-containing oxidoreductase [Aureimonas fodinaquatilis]|uniref:FAD-containing oxidoreductase n=1 Tax=Aureimonas fodinaquatilis TaxID=2565783 RepID=A0A5B0DVM1_9HYPH|nr:FAD-containing oxidoreductase [Aureimonas fodinaquatilis]KAA0970463.1 FAD-containing oxidoreductase [Aureimonas fodinaquatilis]